jgi:hypothetical protein
MAESTANESLKGKFALFISSVPGHVVNRYGAGPSSYIGARRLREGGWEWSPEIIEAITPEELTRYRREYTRAIAQKALKEHSEDAFLAQVAKREAAESAAREKASEPVATVPTKTIEPDASGSKPKSSGAPREGSE